MVKRAEAQKRSTVKKPKAVTVSPEQLLEQRNAELVLENTRLLEEARHHAQEITTMAEIGREISASLDLSIVLERIASRAMGLLHARDVVLRLLEPDGRLPAAVAIGKYANIYRDWHAHLGQGLSGSVAQTGIAEIINDPENDPRVIDIPGTEQDKATRAILFAPMLIGESVIGVLSVWRDKVDAGPFTQADLDFGLSLARQAAIAIQNARLYADTQQSFKETEILRAANVALTKSLDLDTILGVLLDYLQELVPYDTGSVFLMEDENHLTALATRGYEQWVENPALAIGISFDFRNISHIRTVIEDQTTFVIPDVTQYSGWVVAETAKHIRNWLAVPLIVAGKTIGMYSLDKVEPGYFTPEHQRLAENLASQAAIAFQNARLYRNEQVARQQAETLHTAALAVGSTLSLQKVFELILSELRKVVPYDSCSVQQLDGNTMVIVGGHGFPNLDELLGLRFPTTAGDLSSNVINSRQPYIVDDVSASIEHFRNREHGLGRIHGWLGVPLIFGDRLIGMLALDKHEAFFYTPEYARLAMAFATQAATAIENARLFETEQLARKQAETLHAAALALGSTLSLRQVFELILSELRKVVPYDSCTVQQLDGNTMVIVGGNGFPNLDELLGNRFDWSGPDDPAGDVVRRRETVIIADVSARFEHFKDETHGQGKVHGWMGVPLLFGERLIGMLTLDKLEEGYYTAEHAHMAQAFATQAATAIENARLFETEQLARQQAETLRAAALALGSTLSLQGVFELILSELRKVVPYDSCSVQQLDGNEMVIVGGHGFPNLDELLGNRFDWRAQDDPAGDVVRRREPVIIADVSARFEHFQDETHGQGRVHGWLGVPLLFGERMIGMITLDKLEKDFYTAEHAHMAQAFATQAATAIENARLFDETQRLLKISEDRTAELEAISKVSQALIAEAALDSTIQLIGSQMREIFHADIVYLALLDPQTNLIHFPYQFGESFTTLNLGEGLTSKIIQTGEPLLINSDVNERTLEIGASPVGREALSYLGVPIKTGKGTIGVISVQSTTQEGMFTDDSLRLLTTIAANAGAALHNAQLFSEALENLRQVEILTNAASAIEQSAYEPAMVESVAARTDALGELARVFAKMADEVRLREQRLKRQLAQMQLDIEEKRLAKAETVAIYVPMDRRQAMAQHVSLPEVAHGTALFADISGFTTLTESLANELGLQRGAEEMIRHLNRVFTALIDEVHRYSGAVISFSGDAITCWFDDLDLHGASRADSSVERAAACAFAMQNGMTQFTAISTPNGKTIGLSIKVALAVGPTRRMTVGDGSAHQIDVLAGATLSALADAEHVSNTGEIILSAKGVSSFEKIFNVSEWREERRYAVLTGLTKDIAPSTWTPLANDAIPESQLQPWMHPTVFEKVRAGQSDMLSELRPATALFLKFGGLDYDNDPEAGAKLNQFIQWVEGVIAPHNGSIIQFTVGDKGSYIYIVFGAPIAHKDDAAQAVFTALELAAPPESLSYMTDLFIGLASGQMRVGAYGGSSHRTYGAIGDRTNLAARLMVAASVSSAEIPDGQHAVILCNDSIYDAAQAQVEFEFMPPIHVKGKTEPIAIYRPLRKLVEVNTDSGIALERAQVIDNLSPAEQLTIKVASVIGQLFTLESLSSIYPEAHTRETLQSHLQTFADSDLIHKHSLESSSYSFKDPQTHEAAYNLMLFAQRRQLHRAVAELLEQNIFGVPAYAEIAHHWQSANEIPKAIEYLEKAGEHARQNGDFEEATRFFNESLALNN